MTQCDLTELRERADNGVEGAIDELIEVAVELGDLGELRRLADSGNTDAVDVLVELAGERSDMDELRRLADRGSTTAADELIELALSDYLARPTRWGTASRPLFANANGNHLRPDNIRDRVVDPAVKCANELLVERGQATIEHAIPHSLRPTYIALLLTAGADVAYVMAQVGHKDPKLRLRSTTDY